MRIYLPAVLFTLVALFPSPAGSQPREAPGSRERILKQPIPDIDKQREAETLIRSLFKADYAASDPEAMAALAGKLLVVGLDTNDDPTGRYVALREARDLAARAGKLQEAVKAIEAMADTYSIDPLADMVQALQAAAEVATVSETAAIASTALKMSVRAMAADEYRHALQATLIAETSARKVSDDLKRQCRGSILRILTLSYEHGLATAVNALIETPHDAQGSLALGKFMCFVKGDWEKGLRLIAEGHDLSLSPQARADLREPRDPSEQVEVGEGWWTLGHAEARGAGIHILERSRFWYEKAFPHLTGLTKLKVGKRLEELENVVAGQKIREVEEAKRVTMQPDEEWDKWLQKELRRAAEFNGLLSSLKAREQSEMSWEELLSQADRLRDAYPDSASHPVFKRLHEVIRANTMFVLEEQPGWSAQKKPGPRPSPEWRETPKAKKPDNSFAPIRLGMPPASPFACRLQKDARLVQCGGSPATEEAVHAGLRWLARHQKSDGRWDSDGFVAECGRVTEGTCGGPGYPEFDTGNTGLALLAFLGAGYTHLSKDTYDGICFGTVVKKGIQWLQANQDAEGCVGGKSGSKYMYNHSIASLALCEAYGLTGSGLFKDNAQNSINFLIAAQNPYKAWRYTAKSRDNDSSVTGWCVMALKSAEISGLSVPRGGYEGTKAWFDEVTSEDYRVGYTAKGTGQVVVAGKNENFSNHEALTAIAIMGRIFIDKNRNDPRLKGGADLLVRDLPVWDGAKIDFYYWYYASLALFQLDGPSGPFWKAWNENMKNSLVNNQKKTSEGCLSGSWDPIDRWGFEGGRVYAVAINVLTLEVYYRYENVFGSGRGK
jgi:hypothetical protein